MEADLPHDTGNIGAATFYIYSLFIFIYLLHRLYEPKVSAVYLQLQVILYSCASRLSRQSLHQLS